MIEVIKHGSRYMVMVCETCGCEFRYNEVDTYASGNFPNHRVYVKCPECGYPNSNLRGKLVVAKMDGGKAE